MSGNTAAAGCSFEGQAEIDEQRLRLNTKHFELLTGKNSSKM
jgi:hypothetical protein